MNYYKISDKLVTPFVVGPSPTKISQVANMQNFIQGLLGETHHTFLQGSYKNSTSISDINDVDIVAVKLNTYSNAHSPLGPFDNNIPWEEIFSDIEQKLRNQRRYTNWTIERGDKCIKISGAFNADVVPAVQVGRDYLEDPIVVFSFRDSLEKINYPRVHYKNGVNKNQLTNDKYKPTVRLFKNWAKNHFGDNKDIISSFKMEALVHSADNSNFSDNYVFNFFNVGNNILRSLNQQNSSIMSVCGQENICSDWNEYGKFSFLNKLRGSLGHVSNACRLSSIQEADCGWRKAFNK